MAEIRLSHSYNPADQFKEISLAEDTVAAIQAAQAKNKYFARYLWEAFADWDWMVLPEGVPPYEASKVGGDFAAIKLMSSHMHSMLKDVWRNKDIKPARRENAFIKTLEALDATEAEILIAIKDKKLDLKYPKITRDVVNAAFPTLLVMPEGAVVKASIE